MTTRLRHFVYMFMYLGMDYRTNEPMTLADIFNLEEQAVSGDQLDVKMGF